nr:MAG TPA: hypothetical protein [Caudoviricetes sp.]
MISMCLKLTFFFLPFSFTLHNYNNVPRLLCQ